MTKSGNLYVAYDLMGLFKIGITNDRDKRIRQMKTANPFVAYLFVFETDNPAVSEIELHTMFDKKRVRGEWFSLSSEDLQRICTKFWGKELPIESFDRIMHAIKQKKNVVLPDIFGGGE